MSREYWEKWRKALNNIESVKANNKETALIFDNNRLIRESIARVKEEMPDIDFSALEKQGSEEKSEERLTLREYYHFKKINYD